MKACTVVGREERARYVTPDLSYYWEGEREKCEDNKWDEEKKKGTWYTVLVPPLRTYRVSDFLDCKFLKTPRRVPYLVLAVNNRVFISEYNQPTPSTTPH